MAGTRLYIVRICREGPAFSASARRVDEEVAGHFDQPLALLEFLLGPASPAPPPPQGEHHERDAAS
ncbi:MAG: hypothetical protein JNM33_12540 [Rubrivivax sp.]|nr:hypothetical protein [Rubrivivax sp.]